MSLRAGLRTLFFVLLSVAACSGPAQLRGAQFRAATKSYAAGQGQRVDRLARGFWARGQPAPAGYGYYVYLVFADSQPDTLEQRRAAAAQFLELFTDVATVQELEPELPRARLALALAPIRDPEDALALTRRKDVERLLMGYDYERGALLRASAMTRAGTPLPRLALVGSSQPLGAPGSTPTELTVTPLCGGASEVGKKMRDFSDGLLVAPSEGNSTSFGGLLRRVFDSLGSLIIMGSAVAGEKVAVPPESCP